jgi:hypothetical protein
MNSQFRLCSDRPLKGRGRIFNKLPVLIRKALAKCGAKGLLSLSPAFEQDYAFTGIAPWLLSHWPASPKLTTVNVT